MRRPGSDPSDSFREFFEDSARQFRARYRDSALQLIDSQKAALEQFNHFLKDQHETGSAELSKFLKMLMAGQLQALTMWREAEERAFHLQSGIVEAHLDFLNELEKRLKGDQPNDADQPSES